jgi:outer membrane protein assembly factor BamA
MVDSRTGATVCVLLVGLLLWPALGLATYVDTDEQEADSTKALLKTTLLKTHSTHINAYPYAFYTPETQLAFGVGGIATFYTARVLSLRPSKVTLSGYYSTNKQYKFTLGSEVFWARNTIVTSLGLSYGFFVDKFWGVGNSTPETGNEQYTSKSWGLNLIGQVPPLVKLLGNTHVGGIFDYMNNEIVDKMDNAFLLNDVVLGSEGGITSGLGALWEWDRRDSIFYPRTGGLYSFQATFYMKAIGSDFDFNRYTVDLRRYIGLGKKPVLALQLYSDLAYGSPPFYLLPALGGPMIMRGYFTGRYRDYRYLAGQAEYRHMVWRRWGYVVFAGLGEVGERFQDFTLEGTKYSVGFGIRFLFNKAENVNLRADFGFGEDSSGVYFAMEEAF